MPHETALIATIAAGLGLAFLFGLIAVRLRLPALVGYLLAGIAVGPFTPGYVVDAGPTVARFHTSIDIANNLLLIGSAFDESCSHFDGSCEHTGINIGEANLVRLNQLTP